jgi:hypothetical protein
MARDESYVLDICDRVLKSKSLRQHRFDELRGDPGRNGTKRRLPVDAYYPELAMVIEYRERQHTEAVAIMDRRMTISGCTRAEQRRHYDARRRKVIPILGLSLIEIDFYLLHHDSRGRLLRLSQEDEEAIRRILGFHTPRFPTS